VDNIVRDDDGRVRFHFTIVDVVAEWLEGEPVPGGDAVAARWADAGEWNDLVAWEPLRAVLRLAQDARTGS